MGYVLFVGGTEFGKGGGVRPLIGGKEVVVKGRISGGEGMGCREVNLLSPICLHCCYFMPKFIIT